MMANYLAEEVLSKHNPFNKEYRIIRKSDGEVRWVLGLGAVGLDNNGNVISLIGTIQDITERKKADEILIHAKEAAEKSEIKVRSMFENTATGIVFFSPEGNVLEANPSAIRMLGSPSLEATKTVNVLEYKPLIDIGFANDFLKCISENQVITGSSSYITKWNKELFIQYFLIPIFHNKEIIGVWANLQDLTDLWHSQKDLAKAKEIAEQSEHMIIDITNNIPVYIAVVDASTLCYKFVNSKYIDSFNKKREEIIGANIFEIIGKENAEFAMDYINEVRKGNLSSYVNTFDIREGKRYISVNYVPGFDENKEVKDIIVLSYDITDLKKTEEDLLNAKLKAEESDRLKTAFLQNISHEIRTPLNGILGFSNLLSKQEIPGHVIKEYTNLIQESGNKLLEIINDVLDISKIETGQIMVQIKPISINSLLADLFSFFSPTAKQKNLDLSYTTFLKRENSFIETDPTKLNQILTNLINNSIKFTKRGSVEFGYEIFGDEILFYVKDSGIGIPDEMQERIFERFIQSKLSISKGNEGTGLGLAICKGLVKILGGKIWLESEMHKGSTFYFSIPYRPFLEIEEINQVVTANENLLKKTTILIAEDHYISFRYLQELLQKDNIIILHAENGEQAIEFVKNNPDIDIVLMDIRMPVMDGIEATKLIKNIRPNLPIVAQTAYAFSDEKEMIISIGCTDYISKPIEKNELFKLIAKYTK
jgi:PAS domain S-box-containing protein